MHKYNPQIHHRRSIRLKEYDYTRCGVYYVTICTYRRESLFGEMVDGKMVLNPFGRVVATYWQRLPRHFPRVQLGAWVVMPNHVHGIIIIADDGDDNDSDDDRNRRGEATPQASRYSQMPENAEAPGQAEPGGGCLALASDMAPYIHDKDEATPQPSPYAQMREDARRGEATPHASIYAQMRGDAEAPGQTESGGGCLALASDMAPYIHDKDEATPQPSAYAEMRGDAEAPGQAESGGGCLAPTVTDDVAMPHGAPPGSVGAIVGNVKSTITRRINQMRRTPGAKIWQRNYWERVVRSPEEHARIEDYILLNPARWQGDDLHPDAPPNPFNQERE